MIASGSVGHEARLLRLAPEEFDVGPTDGKGWPPVSFGVHRHRALFSVLLNHTGGSMSAGS